MTTLPSVALLPWGDLLEDFLDPLGLQIEDYVREMSGGWLFGYVDALASAGVRSVIVCVSATVDVPTRYVHAPSGSPLWLLPATRTYRMLRRLLVDPYAWSGRTAGGDRSRLGAVPAATARHLAPYASTPVRALSRVLAEEGCGAVLCQEYEEARYDVVAHLGRRLGVPVSATFQGGSGARTAVERLVRRRTLRMARSLVVASSAEARRLARDRGVPPSTIARIPNPLSTTEWVPGDRDAARRALGLPAAAKVVVWHGRVEYERKGLDVLLDAWARLLATAPGQDMRLLMVGSGTDAPRLRDHLDRHQLQNVLWLDRYTLDRDELRVYLHAADVAVLSSRHEGFAVAPLEAMACGLPVVATAVDGIADLLPHGREHGGVIVPVGDAAELGDALALLLDGDLGRARQAGRQARAWIETEYSSRRVGTRLRAAVLPG